MLRELDNRVSAGLATLSVSESEILENYIRPLLDRLRARLCMVGDPVASLAVSVKANRHLTDFCIPSFPDGCSTLRNARGCLLAILEWGRSKLPQRNSSHPLGVTPYLRHLCATWEMALSRSPTSEPSLNFHTIQRSKKLMRIRCLFGRILLECIRTTTECIYDNYLSEFATIVQLTGETAQSNDASFGIDSGLVDILAFVGQCCRDPQIRRSAMACLGSGQRVGGDRGSFMAAKILQTLIELEEAEMNVGSCYDIPEARRWRVLQGAQYLSHGKLRLDLIGNCDSLTHLQVWIPILIPEIKEPQRLKASDLPDIVFGGGFVAFLDEGEQEGYFRFCSDSFYFPIPRV